MLAPIAGVSNLLLGLEIGMNIGKLIRELYDVYRDVKQELEAERNGCQNCPLIKEASNEDRLARTLR